MQHVHDREAGVEADEVGELEGAHRVVGAELQRGVDGDDGADALVERVDRLVDHRHQHAVDDEGGEVLGARGDLADLLDHAEEHLVGRLVGGDAADELDELHHRHRVHEVEAHEPLRPVGAGGEPRDRDRRGVGGQDGVGAEVRHQRLEDLVLQRLLLGRRLDDEVAPPERREVALEVDAAEGGVAVGLGDLAAVNLAVQVAADDPGRGVERLVGDVVQDHVEAGEREDVGDAVAHLSGADDADALDFHGVPVPAR